MRLWVEMLTDAGRTAWQTVSLLVRLWVEILGIVYLAYCLLVSLLVRLWVEIFTWGLQDISASSASLWGCELKYVGDRSAPFKYCQPPCEAVSWNVLLPLLLLLWNTSASLWGCELKYYSKLKGRIIEVSLLVRLWVEISTMDPVSISLTRQPPCEAVSWNK